MRIVRFLGYIAMLIFALAALVVLALPLHAQRQNTFYVDQFRGYDVGTKTANAQAACNPSYPCVLIFDTTLAALPAGVTPTKGNNETWVDWRSGGITSFPGNVIYADKMTGADSATKINAAAATCPAYTVGTANTCVIVAPAGMACGEPNQLKDNVLFIDYRNCAQSQGLRFNLSVAAAGNVRSKWFLQDNFGADTIGLGPHNSSATDYVFGYVDRPEATDGTIAAFNASMATNTQGGNFLGVLVGIEGEAFANSTNGTPRTAADVRGGTFNVLCGGNTSCTSIFSLVAQSPLNTGTGTVGTAASFKAEPSNVAGATTNLAAWLAGNVQIDGTLKALGNIGVGVSATTGAAVLVQPSSLSGTSQYGVQVATQGNSAATSQVSGLIARADTQAAAFTVNEVSSLYAQNPSKGAGSTITNAYGLHIANITAGTNNYGIKVDGGQSVLAGGVTTGSAVTAGRAVCWKDTSGHLGYCSTQPDASGACTCN